MQILGLALLFLVVWFGFSNRADTISAFDPHAGMVVLGGSVASILVSSSAITVWRTLVCLRELIPGLGTMRPGSRGLDAERTELMELWLSGKRAQAVELAERSAYPAVKRMLDLVIDRAPDEATRNVFTELRHAELARYQPAIGNWEVLSKLAPSYGMIGTIAGMIMLFQRMGEDDVNLGASISLALVSTLYGVVFGAGMAGPFGSYLRGLLDDRLGVLERCEHTVGEMIARSARVSRAVGA